jgi:hypothetical protein
MTSAAVATRLSQIGPTSLRRPTSALSVTKAPRQSRDAPILAELLELHAAANPSILDATYGHGNIWGHLPIRHQVIKVDINPELHGLDLVADWRNLATHYPPGSIDCLVWDPIHVADVGRTSKRYSRYVAPQNPVKGESVTHLFPAFFDVAEQLLKPRTGIVLAKMCDQVHAGMRQWQCDVLRAVASGRGWTACDRKIVHKPPAGRDPKHKVKYHAGEQLAEWIVLRNGPACHGPGRRLKYELKCIVCGTTFSARRSGARTCPGGRCRQRRHRANEAA